VVPQDLTEVRWWLLLSDLAWVSLGWAILNLLPILPLDGGLVTRRILGHRAGERGELAAVGLSIATALAGAAWAYGADRTGLALYAIFFAGWNVVTLVRARDGRSRERLDEGRRQLRAGQKAEAERSFRQAAETGSHRARGEAGEALAWLLIDDGRMEEAREVAGRIREEPATPSLLRSYLDLLDGRTEEAATSVATWWLDGPGSFPGTIVINEMDRADVLMPFLERVLTEPGDAPITIGQRVQGSLHVAGRYRSSIAVGTRLLDDARSPSPMVAYNIACSTARDGHLGLALDWLDRAVEAGWRDPSQMTIDDDLAPLQRLPRFEMILGRAARSTP
jgi:Flp pilus assembly protein TadD